MNEPAQMPPAAAGPDTLGQATAVEQARAVAEVQAAIVVAQQCPRDLAASVEAMRESCRQPALAERAFYRFPRGGATVTGPSVHLARELARCWGNVQYGVHEMRRDDDQGISEMQAWAWDVQTNTRSSHTFVVPHKRDKRDGPERLVDMRDIYENNANAGARRLREALFAVLPVWFTDEAKGLCAATVRDGGGKPLPARIATCVAEFAQIGVTVDRIEAKVGRPRSQWNDHDVAQLLVSFKSLQRGEVRVEDEFPDQRVTVEELLAGSPPGGEGVGGGDDSRAVDVAPNPGGESEEPPVASDGAGSDPSPTDTDEPVDAEVVEDGPITDATREAVSRAIGAAKATNEWKDRAQAIQEAGIPPVAKQMTEAEGIRALAILEGADQ